MQQKKIHFKIKKIIEAVMYSFQVYGRMTYFQFNSMFFVNFLHYYTLCFRACSSWSNKAVDFDLLAVLLYLLSTRVGEMRARTSLIYVHSCSFIARSFSLNVNDRKRIPFLFTSRDNGHRQQTPRFLAVYCSLTL
jgi:hypothetical protein